MDILDNLGISEISVILPTSDVGIGHGIEFDLGIGIEAGVEALSTGEAIKGGDHLSRLCANWRARSSILGEDLSPLAFCPEIEVT